MTPDTPVRLLRGVGDARAKLFEKLGVFTARDLLYLMPRRYEDRRALKTLNGIADGEVCAVYVTLSAPAAETRSRSGLPMVKAVAEDGTGELYLTFFNNKWVKNTLVKGATLRVYGSITFGMYGRETVNPTVEAVFDGKSLEKLFRKHTEAHSKKYYSVFFRKKIFGGFVYERNERRRHFYPRRARICF